MTKDESLTAQVASIAAVVQRIPELADGLKEATRELASAQRSWTQGRAADSQALADLRAELRVLTMRYQQLEERHAKIEKRFLAELAELRKAVEENSDLRKEALWTRRFLLGGASFVGLLAGIGGSILAFLRLRG